MLFSCLGILSSLKFKDDIWLVDEYIISWLLITCFSSKANGGADCVSSVQQSERKKNLTHRQNLGQSLW